ncbi:HPr family phosphocarrier protein [Sporanaerobacter sp. PP17-6a]|jgi:phosphotransferase system HPr (HPr) family protein|uniref:HPr family phosphocarrier protein n=1 Tax=Sporanaerobacter sp. PP17-6a TaxID=1891289 RepID=UPI00089FAAE9|nr:HPr family phosphocarrier protein [Sporanaerobacter sp. PP17-6a]MBE6083388.1 HPr family phosphocarrier protein [Tissierellaceae bacterium]SCL88318.1 Phosphocarrier protein HPr [Sporanaerobacter sp. PP17-6a]
MYKETVTIVNPTGLHARPATTFVRCVSKFNSHVLVKKVNEGKMFDGRSIIMLLSSGLEQNTEIEISAEGDDEELAVKSLVEFVKSLKD